MIEVRWADDGKGWTWFLMCARGRDLVYTSERYPSILAAAEGAKAYRVAFWAIADQIDHRQARCV